MVPLDRVRPANHHLALVVATLIVSFSFLVTPSDAACSNSDRPQTRIVGTYFDFIDRTTTEGPNDGLSTYVLLTRESDDADAFLNAFFRETMPINVLRKGKVQTDQSKLNIAYIPVGSTKHAWVLHKESMRLHPRDPGGYAGCMAGYIAAVYDYSRAQTALSLLCTHMSPAPTVCGTDFSVGGPYLITVICRGWRRPGGVPEKEIPCSATPDWSSQHPGIVLDLTGYNRQTYKLLIKEYKQYVISHQPQDNEWTILEPFRAKVADTLIKASEVFQVARKAHSQAIEIFGAGQKK